MDVVVSLAGALGALALGTISPGPSFVLVGRIAVSASRLDGLAAAVGMGLGGVVFTALALLGLHVVFATIPWLYAGLKVLGGAYLIYLAVRIWRGAREPLTFADAGRTASATLGRSVLLGLSTQLSNPKTAVVYGSVFAALLPHDLPRAAALALLPLVFLLEAGWYAVVAVALSSASPRAAYLRWKGHIDRVTAGVMGFLGIKLLAGARSAS